MKIIASIATMPGREECLKEAVKSLENQVDEVIVYDNATMPNLTDKGKFYALSKIDEDCLYLSCDDDLIYPPNYVEKVVEGLERHKGAAVTFHGRILNRNGTNYYTSHRVFRCLYNVTRDIRVDVAGTGVTAFYTKDFNSKDLHLSPHNRMADLVFSLEAAKQGLPVFCLKHPSQWIKHAEIDLSQTIYYQDRHDCSVHNELASEIYSLIYKDFTIRNREKESKKKS